LTHTLTATAVHLGATAWRPWMECGATPLAPVKGWL
jgi:hypothetical protein